MNDKQDDSKNVTVLELVLAAMVVLILFVPIFLLKIHPDMAWVQKYLGSGRILLFWGVGFAFLYWVESFVRKLQGRPPAKFLSFDKD